MRKVIPESWRLLNFEAIFEPEGETIAKYWKIISVDFRAVKIQMKNELFDKWWQSIYFNSQCESWSTSKYKGFPQKKAVCKFVPPQRFTGQLVFNGYLENQAFPW